MKKFTEDEVKHTVYRIMFAMFMLGYSVGYILTILNDTAASIFIGIGGLFAIYVLLMGVR